METIFSRAEPVDGIRMVQDLVQLMVEFTCAGKPGESVEFSSSAMTGLSYVLQMAEEALGVALGEIETRDELAGKHSGSSGKGGRKHLKAL